MLQIVSTGNHITKIIVPDLADKYIKQHRDEQRDTKSKILILIKSLQRKGACLESSHSLTQRNIHHSPRTYTTNPLKKKPLHSVNY